MFSSNTSQVSNAANYIEDVFSTWLYTGNGSTQTITNGIDLAGKGGLVWVKRRNSPANDHAVMDTARGIATNGAWTLIPNGTYDQFDTNTVTSFNSNGFTLGSSSFGNSGGGFDYASWTFRKQPKFFDVVTYTGNGAMDRNIAHSLGSVPACIIIKRTDTTSNWVVWHGSNFSGGYATSQKFLYLNTTGASPQIANGYVADSYNSSPSTQFMVLNSNGYGSSGSVTDVNASGGTYVAYLYAHNAGGFGLTGTDNVISCGSFTCDGSGDATVTLGYEPQWILRKASNEITNWELFDNMRGLSVTDNATKLLYPNLSNAEENTSKAKPTATGFIAKGEISKTYIYIAIRRGPMKVPTSGTSVFNTIARAGTSAPATMTSGFAADLVIARCLQSTADTLPYASVRDRLRGITPVLTTSSTSPENTSNSSAITAYGNTTVTLGDDTDNAINKYGQTYANWIFGRAPGFFDEVCYSGNSATPRNITHNLGVAPELMIIKSRSNDRNWPVFSSAIGAGKYLIFNSNPAPYTDTTIWANTAPTSSVFTVGDPFDVNNSGYTYVAYLFATCAGVSKVGSYTGNGSSQSINCGFTSGARFIMFRRYDDAGSWTVFDSARGITSGNDPFVRLNQTAAETGASYNSVDPYSSGFTVIQNDASQLNISGATYIFLAIA